MIQFKVVIGFSYNEDGPNKATIESTIVKMIEGLEEQPVTYEIAGHNEFGILFVKECESELAALKWAKKMEKSMIDKVPDSPVTPNESIGVVIEAAQ